MTMLTSNNHMVVTGALDKVKKTLLVVIATLGLSGGNRNMYCCILSQLLWLKASPSRAGVP